MLTGRPAASSKISALWTSFNTCSIIRRTIVGRPTHVALFSPAGSRRSCDLLAFQRGAPVPDLMSRVA